MPQKNVVVDQIQKNKESSHHNNSLNYEKQKEQIRSRKQANNKKETSESIQGKSI
jgi:hypothetical protein